MKKQILITLKIFLILSIITGVLYPLVITGIAQLIFPKEANGSLILVNNQVRGSSLIGQRFDSVGYFWSRPSAIDYNPLPSGGSNLGPTSDKLADQVKTREHNFRFLNQVPENIPTPSEMVFSSGSGLDPHISMESALLQVNRIVSARKFDNNRKLVLIKLVDVLAEDPQFHIFGQRRVNVLLLNLELDKIK